VNANAYLLEQYGTFDLIKEAKQTGGMSTSARIAAAILSMGLAEAVRRDETDDRLKDRAAEEHARLMEAKSMEATLEALKTSSVNYAEDIGRHMAYEGLEKEAFAPAVAAVGRLAARSLKGIGGALRGSAPRAATGAVKAPNIVQRAGGKVEGWGGGLEKGVQRGVDRRAMLAAQSKGFQPMGSAQSRAYGPTSAPTVPRDPSAARSAGKANPIGKATSPSMPSGAPSGGPAPKGTLKSPPDLLRKADAPTMASGPGGSPVAPPKGKLQSGAPDMKVDKTPGAVTPPPGGGGGSSASGDKPLISGKTKAIGGLALTGGLGAYGLYQAGGVAKDLLLRPRYGAHRYGGGGMRRQISPYGYPTY